MKYTTFKTILFYSKFIAFSAFCKILLTCSYMSLDYLNIQINMEIFNMKTKYIFIKTVSLTKNILKNTIKPIIF